MTRALTRVKYWMEKTFSPNFGWGHPDEWSDAEWFYYKKGRL